MPRTKYMLACEILWPGADKVPRKLESCSGHIFGQNIILPQVKGYTPYMRVSDRYRGVRLWFMVVLVPVGEGDDDRCHES